MGKINENHILPFFWIHGDETHEHLESLIDKIQEVGIQEICVESRPHEKFNEDGWFNDLGFILECLKKRNMKMWLFDDSHFPTGYANGKLLKENSELRKKFLCMKTYDYVGPVQGAAATLNYVMKSPEDKLLGVYLQKIGDDGTIDPSETIDLTASVQYMKCPELNCLPNVNEEILNLNDQMFVEFDLPKGRWNLNILFSSFHGGEKHTEGFLNPLDENATKVLLDEVYEPIYAHFKDEFGKTFKGFFSDEPRFGNIHGAENASIGRNPEMVLPWKDYLLDVLKEHCDKTQYRWADGKELHYYLPLLFIGDSKDAWAIRYIYMDLVSALYRDNFDRVLSNWCHEHSVMHIGHTIEDNNAVARLGYGTGHFFRSMENSDMAGIDVVLQQLLPECDKGYFKGFHKPGWDGEFFTFVLGKLGGSLAHLNPNAKGRCVCEVFGAYGWAFGNKLAKWIVDYMLVRGVNYFIPHAFDAHAFPDMDCPSHIYADGYNPQYKEFSVLCKYMQNMGSLLEGGKAVTPVGVLFYADAEWSGDYMKTQVPASYLARNQIDYEIVPSDYLYKAEVKDSKLMINNQSMEVLIIPESEALPSALIERLKDLQAQGVQILFINHLPSRTSEGNSYDVQFEVIKLHELVLRLQSYRDIVVDQYQEYLRYYHYQKEGNEIFLFTNESKSKRIQCNVQFDNSLNAYVYDPVRDTYHKDSNAFSLDLPPYGSKVVVLSSKVLSELELQETEIVSQEALTNCMVKLYDYRYKSEVCNWEFELDHPKYISSIEGFERFSGRIDYIFEYQSDHEFDGLLQVHNAQEGISVYVNDTYVDTRICPDYVFHVHIQKGKNKIVVHSNTTLGRAMGDYISQFMLFEPTGIQDVILCEIK